MGNPLLVYWRHWCMAWEQDGIQRRGDWCWLTARGQAVMADLMHHDEPGMTEKKEQLGKSPVGKPPSTLGLGIRLNIKVCLHVCVCVGERARQWRHCAHCVPCTVPQRAASVCKSTRGRIKKVCDSKCCRYWFAIIIFKVSLAKNVSFLIYTCRATSLRTFFPGLTGEAGAVFAIQRWWRKKLPPAFALLCGKIG